MSKRFIIEELSKATPYMLRNDEQLIECSPLHPYIKYVHEDILECIKHLRTDRFSSLVWFYKNTLKQTTKQLIRNIVKYLDISSNEFEVDKNTYLPTEQEIEGFIETLNADTNQEFLRMRTSSMLFGGSSNEIYFRISSINFNWFPQIWNIIYKYINNISNITICKDSNTFGGKFEPYKLNGVAINHLAKEDFLILKGNPIIEKLNSKYDAINNSFSELFKGKSISESYNYLHPNYVRSFYSTQVKDYLEFDMTNILSLNEKFEQHNILNPKIWNEDNTLKDDISKKLYQIIEQYIEDSQILTHDDILTAEIVGSNASYNYTDKSDLDLHLIVDMSELSKDPKFAQLANDGEKALFNRRYDLNLRGCQVEVYIEDVKTSAVSNGVFDLYTDEWVRFPFRFNVNIDQDKYLRKYETTEHTAKELLKQGTTEDIIKFINDLYLRRRKSLQTEGEPGTDNQIFKDLRNNDILSQLKDKIAEMKSDELSLTEAFDETIEDVYDAKYLYHATYKPYLREIKKSGYILPGVHKNWEISNDVIYLCRHKDNAVDYAETAKDVPEEFLNQIIVLVIDTNKLDLNALDIDHNQVYDYDYNIEDLTSIEEFEYSEKIPLSAVTDVIEIDS